MTDRLDASKRRVWSEDDVADEAAGVGAGTRPVQYESDRYKREESPHQAAALQHSTLPPPQSIVNDKYRIDAELGRGGMGAVYRAYHVELSKGVALKWLLPELATDQDSRQRFGREARAASNIKHENVVDVYDYGIDPERGVPYIVMELLTGVSLSAYLEQRKRLDVHEALDIMIQCMRGVAAAHKLGIVHRDLKPENIFLCESDEPESHRVKVLDFGVAAALEPTADQPLRHIITRTASRNVVGTLFYMSAEQLAGGSVDARADVYAIGVILYELLFGKPPYAGETYNDLATAILDGNAAPLMNVVPGLDPALSQLIHRAMAPRKADRFADMSEAIQAFQQYRKRLRNLSIREPMAEAPTHQVVAEQSSVQLLDRVRPVAARVGAALSVTAESARRIGASGLALLGAAWTALASRVGSARARGALAVGLLTPRAWIGVACALLVLGGLLAWSLMPTRVEPPQAVEAREEPHIVVPSKAPEKPPEPLEWVEAPEVTDIPAQTAGGGPAAQEQQKVDELPPPELEQLKTEKESASKGPKVALPKSGTHQAQPNKPSKPTEPAHEQPKKNDTPAANTQSATQQPTNKPSPPKNSAPPSTGPAKPRYDVPFETTPPAKR